MVTAADVDAMCLDDGSRNLLRLLDGLCLKESTVVLKSLYAISKNGELIPLISALHNRMAWPGTHRRIPAAALCSANALGARDYAWKICHGCGYRSG